MSKQYCNQHIDQAIRYVILTNVGALVESTIGACVGDGLTGALVRASVEGAMVRPTIGACVGDGITGALVRASVEGASVYDTVGTMVGFLEGLDVTGLSPGDTVGSDVVGLDVTGLRLGDLDGLEVSGSSPQLAQNGPPTSCTGLF